MWLHPRNVPKPCATVLFKPSTSLGEQITCSHSQRWSRVAIFFAPFLFSLLFFGMYMEAALPPAVNLQGFRAQLSWLMPSFVLSRRKCCLPWWAKAFRTAYATALG